MGIDLAELQENAKKFVDERDWRRFQSIKELAVNASVEANELLELFQWQDGKETDERLLSGKDPELMQKIKDETADVFFTCLAIADQAKFDMGEAFLSKFAEINKRYDKDKVRGNPGKIPSEKDAKLPRSG